MDPKIYIEKGRLTLPFEIVFYRLTLQLDRNLIFGVDTIVNCQNTIFSCFNVINTILTASTVCILFLLKLLVYFLQ